METKMRRNTKGERGVAEGLLLLLLLLLSSLFALLLLVVVTHTLTNQCRLIVPPNGVQLCSVTLH